ncbi:hypothetical protein [Bradyrhizobium sp. Ai1a-2]|uniref:hypothetical protein n=1 Tax=Bradyrhizobium sp. Ai1a-2 TaxID=196490 RepID=UPI00126959F2|nr:hypothetical protein [Bradyrhizobium sp. Ai1a-2]
MKIASRISAAFFALALVLMIVPPANASGGREHTEGDYSGHVSGAPGPIAGAGLPILAIGYGVYWLMKRRRKHD